MVKITSSETPPVVGHEFKPALVLVRPGLCELHGKNAPGVEHRKSETVVVRSSPRYR